MDPTLQHAPVLGELPEKDVRLVQAALHSIRMESFLLRINGIGVFLQKNQAVLWAGLETFEALSVLKRKVDTVLMTDAGIRPEQKNFSPHITLGRMKKPDKTFLENFIACHGHTIKEDWLVSSFTLFSSALMPDGAVHTPEEYYLLGKSLP